jgi:hypothetical protein
MSRRAALTSAAALAALAGGADAFAIPAGLPAAAWSRHAAAARPVSLRPAPGLSVRMAEASASSEPLSRKGKNKLKKATKAEATVAKKQLRKQVDAILDELFDEIEAEKRDLAKVTDGARGRERERRA